MLFVGGDVTAAGQFEDESLVISTGGATEAP
jgi:hypothetical protein